MLRTVEVTRYVAPLREGGSLPAIVEADDNFLYVLKFKGAGHGSKALISEFIGGEIARELGFRVPELVFAHLDSSIGRTEGDEEIQDLLKASHGLNLGLHYLSGAITYDPLVLPVIAKEASQIVWLDSYLLNIDRTPRNANMLWWHNELWLIDQGASLYFHHSWQNWDVVNKPFPMIKDHILLNRATELEQVNAEFKNKLTKEFLTDLVLQLPEAWLENEPAFSSLEEHRNAYITFLHKRLDSADYFTQEADNARKALI
ncbi:MAG TPA: HipA family kinase [Flavobacteriales bacterium]